MANEITVNVSMSLRNGYLVDQYQPGAVSVTQTTQGKQSAVVIVGTSEEDLSVGDVATPGMYSARNLDTTNYVTWGPKSGGAMVPIGKMMPGDPPVLFRFDPTATLRWKANTASCRVDVRLYEA